MKTPAGALFTSAGFCWGINLIDWAPQPRILAEYQACHVTYQLKFSSTNLMLADHSLNTALWLVSHHQINGVNFKLIDEVISLVPCKDSSKALENWLWEFIAVLDSCQFGCKVSIKSENFLTYLTLLWEKLL